MSATVEFERRGQVGFATLNRESALNSIDLEMVQSLNSKLKSWQADSDLAVIVIRGKGAKAFCAGGDVKKVCEKARAGDLDYGAQFFSTEYELDHAIHVSPKPIVVVGHGVVMGGGMGLLQGATTRVVTTSSVLAMPEISIGFFPDVGASYFLNRVPGQIGLYLALTGTRFNAGDALEMNLADFFIPDEKLDAFYQEMIDTKWLVDSSKNLAAGGANKVRLRKLLSEFCLSCQVEPPVSLLNENRGAIDRALFPDTPHKRLEQLKMLENHPNPFIQKGIQTFLKGSPTSALVIIEQLRRSRGLFLKQCFEMELVLSAQFCRRHDFIEGVRAVLIDKDRAPRWAPTNWDEVTPVLVSEHFLS